MLASALLKDGRFLHIHQQLRRKAIRPTYRYLLELFSDGLWPRYAPQDHCVVRWRYMSCSETSAASVQCSVLPKSIQSIFGSKWISATRLLLANHELNTDYKEPGLQRA